MDKQTLQAKAELAFEKLYAARTALFVSAECTIQAESAHETAKATALTSGKIDGKNAEIREAQLRAETIVSHEAVEDAKRQERESRYNFDLAQIEMDTVKTFLRIAELGE